MKKASNEFQILIKPVGPICNLGCQYCYYLKKKELFPEGELFRMRPDILEKYIVEHISASPGEVIFFSWHGGEPTLTGLEFFRKVIYLQRKHKPLGKKIINGIQTNGTLINENWARFFAKENFFVGISIDGPEELHNIYRYNKNQESTFEHTIRGFKLLKKHNVRNQILCVVNAHNVNFPLEVYRFFKKLGAAYISFLPLVIQQSDSFRGVSDSTVPAEDYGKFLCSVFDEWQAGDIGRIKVQLFEEAAMVAFGQEHSLCILKVTCGGVPALEHNGDLYSCDQFVDKEHFLGNITDTPLIDLLESASQKKFGDQKLSTLPQFCIKCEVRAMCNGGCQKDRFIITPDGEKGLNYLCPGVRLFFNHCKPFVTEIRELWCNPNG